jgi:hypothetical protein
MSDNEDNGAGGASREQVDIVSRQLPRQNVWVGKMNQIWLRAQDRFLPIANIARIMKKNLPGNAKVAPESVLIPT